MKNLDLFSYENYKIYIRERVQQLPRNGHGAYTKLAEHLSTTSVYVSQVFNGEKELTIEHAIPVSEFFGLSELETEYFMTLIERARAGTHSLKRYYTKKLIKIKHKSKKIKEILSVQKELSENVKAEFFSQWYYNAIWLLTSMENFGIPEQYQDKLRLDLKTVKKALDFLTQNKIIERKGEFFQAGSQFVHLEAESIHIAKHHTNWRLRGLNQLDRLSEEELCFTMPCTISKADFERIRTMLLHVIKSTRDIVGPSSSEEIAFLNIDWMKLKL